MNEAQRRAWLALGLGPRWEWHERLPEEAGDSYEEWKAYETQMAVDFSECGDEVGFAEPSEKAYDKANIDVYLEIEEDVYTWQQEMTDAIAKAQEILDK